MKKFRITLTEEQMAQFESLIGEIPTKWGNPLVNLYAPNTTTTSGDEEEEPTPPIGGGGGAGGPRPPKP